MVAAGLLDMKERKSKYRSCVQIYIITEKALDYSTNDGDFRYHTQTCESVEELPEVGR